MLMNKWTAKSIVKKSLNVASGYESFINKLKKEEKPSSSTHNNSPELGHMPHGSSYSESNSNNSSPKASKNTKGGGKFTHSFSNLIMGGSHKGGMRIYLHNIYRGHKAGI